MSVCAVVGVDTGGLFRAAIKLLVSLRFEQLDALLVNAVESVLPDGSFPELSEGSPITALIEQHKREGSKMLDEAAAMLAKRCHSCQTQLVLGEPSRQITGLADAENADLIVVGAEKKSWFGSLFFGGVTKALIMRATENLLFVKRPPVHPEELTVVFATDHSLYANRVVDRLVALNPRGVKKILVLTADTLDEEMAERLYGHLPETAGRASEWAYQHLETQSQQTAKKLQALSPNVEVLIERMHPNEAIRKTMLDSGADLLIVGAQGHGFMRRVTLGSVSMHQVINEPHNVLVMRH